MAASIREVLNQLPNLHIYIEAVHRLTDLGAVITHVAQGVSQEGFDAEWRMIFIYTVEGNLISRFEFFDEADLDAALARFDELSRPGAATSRMLQPEPGGASPMHSTVATWIIALPKTPLTDATRIGERACVV